MAEFETKETLFAWANENLIGRSLAIDYPYGYGYIFVKSVSLENEAVYLLTDFIYEEILNETEKEYFLTKDKYYPINYRTFGDLIENKKYLAILDKWHEQAIKKSNELKNSIYQAVKYKNFNNNSTRND